MPSSKLSARRRSHGVPPVIKCYPPPPPPPPPPPVHDCELDPPELWMEVNQSEEVDITPRRTDRPEGEEIDAGYWTDGGEFGGPPELNNMGGATCAYDSPGTPGDYIYMVSMTWEDGYRCGHQGIAHVTEEQPRPP